MLQRLNWILHSRRISISCSHRWLLKKYHNIWEKMHNQWHTLNETQHWPDRETNISAMSSASGSYAVCMKMHALLIIKLNMPYSRMFESDLYQSACVNVMNSVLSSLTPDSKWGNTAKRSRSDSINTHSISWSLSWCWDLLDNCRYRRLISWIPFNSFCRYVCRANTTAQTC